MTMASRCGASCATWQISVLNVGFKDSRRTSSYYFSRSIQRNLCPPRLPVPASLHCGRLHAGIPLSFPSLLSTTRRYIDRWPVVVSSSGHQAAAAAARAAAVAAERAPSLYSTPLHPASYRLQLLRSKERQTAGVSIFCLSSRSLHSVAGDAQAEAAPTTSVAASAGVQSEGDMPLHANPSTETAVLKTEPAEGSYAQELFQHIQNATDGATAAAEASSSSSWFIDWLLALKLGLGLQWCWALPAAGCLLRLVTLPVAIDSERDRRQRQLIDPQFSRMKEKMKAAYEAGNTEEYQRLRMETKQLLKKHQVGVLPTSFFHMLLLGIAISLSTPAIRELSANPYKWKDFAAEQPAWLESLALPDSTGLTSLICWAILVSTMAVGWVVSAKIQRRSLSTPAASTFPSPLFMRTASVGAATIFSFYSGMQLPAAAVLFLVPAFALQSAFMRLFRLRSVERLLHFVPEGLRPLQQTYIEMLQRRQPALIAAWNRRSADPKYSDAVAEATAGGAAATSRAMVELWRDMTRNTPAAAAAAAAATNAAGVQPHKMKTWAEQVVAARKQQQQQQHRQQHPTSAAASAAQRAAS